MSFVLHARGETLDDVGVGQVLFLCDLRQRQVLRDEEVDQIGVGAIESVLAAEPPRIATPEFAVVAAAALCNVVEDRGDIEQPRLVEIRHQLAAQRIFVRMFG